MFTCYDDHMVNNNNNNLDGGGGYNFDETEDWGEMVRLVNQYWFNGAYAQNRLYTLGIHWTQYNLDGGGNEVDEAEERWWVGPGPSEEIYSRGNTVIWTQGAHTK